MFTDWKSNVMQFIGDNGTIVHPHPELSTRLHTLYEAGYDETEAAEIVIEEAAQTAYREPLEV